MTFGQFLALLTFIASALPLGAIGMVTALYGAVAFGRAPAEAATLFERLAGRAYCWTMIAILAVAILLTGGWTGRLLLLAVGAGFLRAALDVLPRLDSLGSGAPATVARLARWRQAIATASAAQWLAVLCAYVRLVL
ncbi:MAG: hypothetical protein GEU87_09480 [Alphaproteobacteria bacterium]|nr:hypothetical protein [Alphaproteobacteria bacterium]